MRNFFKVDLQGAMRGGRGEKASWDLTISRKGKLKISFRIFVAAKKISRARAGARGSRVVPLQSVLLRPDRSASPAPRGFFRRLLTTLAEKSSMGPAAGAEPPSADPPSAEPIGVPRETVRNNIGQMAKEAGQMANPPKPPAAERRGESAERRAAEPPRAPRGN